MKYILWFTVHIQIHVHIHDTEEIECIILQQKIRLNSKGNN